MENQIESKKENKIIKIIYKIISIMLVLAWMSLVFNFSSEVADVSSNTSGQLIRKILLLFSREWQINDLNNAVEVLQPLARKLAHFCLYALGGFLIYNVKLSKRTKTNMLISVMIACLYSISDEFHQLFVPGRSAELRDVFIDTAGSILGCTVFIIINKIFDKFRHNTTNTDKELKNK